MAIGWNRKMRPHGAGVVGSADIQFFESERLIGE
jgi:hypothetical protein